MSMKTRMIAKDWLNSLSYEELEKVCNLTNSPKFMEFLVSADMSAADSARYAADCAAVGVPTEYTTSSEALHYLTVAIANYLKGNA